VYDMDAVDTAQRVEAVDTVQRDFTIEALVRLEFAAATAREAIKNGRLAPTMGVEDFVNCATGVLIDDLIDDDVKRIDDESILRAYGVLTNWAASANRI